jgi:hypothetical protein
MSWAYLFAPDIIRYYPAQSGVDNAGIGETVCGERFLLKTDVLLDAVRAIVCLAEYLGASLCQSVGVPCGQVLHATIPWEVEGGSLWTMRSMQLTRTWREFA